MQLEKTINGGPAAAPVKSAARALDLLDEIAANGPGTQLQLSTRLGIPKSSLHALLRTMTDRGWLETDPTGSVYKLGIHSLVVSSAFLDGDSVLARASHLLDEVAAATEETVHLGRLDGAHVIYTAKRESAHPLRMHSAVGRRLPAYATALGRAILAEQPLDERAGHVPDSIAPMTTHTTTDKGAVLDIIDRASQVGYAVESEESCLGVRCFGVTLPFGREAVDAMSVAVPISRLGDGREDFIIETLLSVKARLSVVNDNSIVR
ncbi:MULTISPECIES: IclR family transcriptional regulator [Nocardioides]|uniref:Glycerol operon regulatory protein n=1 Tax=Nocardioides lianchengensis TaxID=1045774 RepID=A0A1G6Q652_9ACTN|nr:IclR family transcriptional regulator [Nocardioides lianchengensis]NYG12086.1 DNA-binding IclR family transcriptional regulator [Nocardioides lianchengensis]SDC87095.1 DNA-binding transcriptional regulator, IclR family [Nocardioides lianchengensis]